MSFFDFNKGFEGASVPQRRPVVGLSANILTENSAVHFAYTKAIAEAGGIPFIIPVEGDDSLLRECVRKIDALVLTGGADIDGRYFGEKTLEGVTSVDPMRDGYEFRLLRAASDCSLPIFGICRGLQVINVAFGGTLYQDLPSQYGAGVLNHAVLENKHVGAHEVSVVAGSWLEKCLQTSSLPVNSRHHQSAKQIADGFRVTATSSEGVVEAIEAYPERRILAVQWHPENMATAGGDVAMKNLFGFFVREARLFAQAKMVHRTHLSVDSHTDTPMLFDKEEIDLGVRSGVAKVDLPKMFEGEIDGVVMVAYIPQDENTPQGFDRAKRLALSLFDRMKTRIAAHPDSVTQVHTPEYLSMVKQKGQKGIFFGLENGYAVGDDLNNIDLFGRLGCIYITLCHNGANQICDSAQGDLLYGGLSPFGEKVIERMNTLGITVDLSHASEKTVGDVVKRSTQPVIASHTSCYALCPHPRNLSDEAILKISTSGGVVQVCLYDGFLKKGGGATVTDAVEHIEHIVAISGSYDYVGIGSDFDGGGGIIGCQSENQIINITVELLRRGHHPNEVAKIIGGNFMRVISENGRL